MQVNLSTENTLDQNPVKSSGYTGARINNFSQANLRFSPGQLWKKPIHFFFEFNVNHPATSWVTSGQSTGHYLWQFYNNGRRLIDFSQKNSNYYVKNEFRPSAKIILYSLFEWNNLTIENRWNSSLQDIINIQYRNNTDA